MLLRTITLTELLKNEKATISEEDVRKRTVVIVPSQYGEKDIIQVYSIAPTKEIMRKAGNSVIAYRNKESKVADFRGGEYVLPLFILQNIALPIFVGIISAWIYDKIKDYKKQKEKEPENPLVKEPLVKVRGYLTEQSKYFEIEGPATDTVKEITKLVTQAEKNGSKRNP
jgi:hypothetical protein